MAHLYVLNRWRTGHVASRREMTGAIGHMSACKCRPVTLLPVAFLETQMLMKIRIHQCLMKHLSQRYYCDDSQEVILNQDETDHAWSQLGVGISCPNFGLSHRHFIMGYNDCMRLFGNRQAVDMAYLDFAKAFNSVSHPKLLRKLHAQTKLN
jgi:hypothetical protein